MYRSILKNDVSNIFIPDTAVDITNLENINIYRCISSQNPIYLKNLVRGGGNTNGPVILFSCAGYDYIHYHLKNNSNNVIYLFCNVSVIDSTPRARNLERWDMARIDPSSVAEGDIGIKYTFTLRYPTYILLDFSQATDQEYASIFLNDESCIYLK